MANGPLLAVEAVIMGFLELKRFQGWKETGTSGFLNAFPFDPAGAREKQLGGETKAGGKKQGLAWPGFSAGVRRQALELLADLAGGGCA